MSAIPMARAKEIFIVDAPADSTEITKASLDTAQRVILAQFVEELKRGTIIFPEVVQNPELSREYQIGIYKQLGIPKILKMTEKEYEDACPQFTDQPENCKGRFNIQLLVNPVGDPGISGRQLFELKKPEFCDWLNGSDVKENSRNIFVPHLPYVVWINSGYMNITRSAEEVMGTLKADEEVPTLSEVVSLVIMHPEILLTHGIDVLGATVDGRYFPEICRLSSKHGNVALQPGSGWADKQFGASTRLASVAIKAA